MSDRFAWGPGELLPVEEEEKDKDAKTEEKADDDRDRLEELYEEIYADDDDAEDVDDLSDEELAEAILARTDSAHRADSAERTATATKAGGRRLIAYTLALHPRTDADEEAEEKCPGCGKMVTPKDGKCPDCGAEMKSDEAAY